MTHYLLSVHSVEGEVRELGRDSEAAAAYERAAAMALTDAERDFLRLGGRAAR